MFAIAKYVKVAGCRRQYTRLKVSTILDTNPENVYNNYCILFLCSADERGSSRRVVSSHLRAGAAGGARLRHRRVHLPLALRDEEEDLRERYAPIYSGLCNRPDSLVVPSATARGTNSTANVTTERLTLMSHCIFNIMN